MHGFIITNSDHEYGFVLVAIIIAIYAALFGVPTPMRERDTFIDWRVRVCLFLWCAEGDAYKVAASTARG